MVVPETPPSNISSAAAATIRCRVCSPLGVSSPGARRPVARGMRARYQIYGTSNPYFCGIRQAGAAPGYTPLSRREVRTLSATPVTVSTRTGHQAVSRPRSQRVCLSLELAPTAHPVVGDDLPEHDDQHRCADCFAVPDGHSAAGLVVMAAGDDPLGVGGDPPVVEEM